MTDEEIVERAKEAEKRTGFGELVHSPISKGVNSAYGVGFIEGMVEYRNSMQEEPYLNWKDMSLQEKKDLLASLQKDIEPASDDLETAIDTYLSTYFGGEKEKQEWPFLKKMAVHFANWQKKKDDYAIEIAHMAGEEEGKNIMKQQLMAKAVDGDITFDYYGDDDKTYGCVAHNSFCLEDLGLKDTDKVKMVLINE